jgi:hypothetical protein
MEMSEFMFGVCGEKISKRTARKLDRIAREIAGKAAGFVTIHPPEGGVKSWFAIPNRGAPFDRQTANKILEKCGLPLLAD